MVELLLVVALLTVLTTIAISSYSGYVDDTKRTALLQQVATIRIFQEDARIRLGRYIAGAYDITNPDDPMTDLADQLGWRPGNGDKVAYQVTTTDDSYEVTARHEDGFQVSRTFP